MGPYFFFMSQVYVPRYIVIFFIIAEQPFKLYLGYWFCLMRRFFVCFTAIVQGASGF